MRILYIHQYFATRRGTTGTRSLEQARAMQADGHEVIMLTSPAQLCADERPGGRGWIRRARIAGIDAVVVQVDYRQEMSFPRRIAAFLAFVALASWVVLRWRGVDLVYATSTPLTVGIPALLGKLVRGVPYVFEVRDLWPDVPIAMGIIRRSWLAKMLLAMEHLIYFHARLIVAVNAGVRRRIVRKTGGRTPVLVVPNACDTDLFRPDLHAGWLRRRCNLDARILCVHSGAMGRVNGLDAVLDAAKALRACDGVRFVLIGEGREKPRLAQRIHDEGLDNVLLLDAVAKEQLAEILAEADIGLVTVLSVGILEHNCANKFFDYLASGLPIVLNFSGWMGESLRRCGCGLAVEQGDTEGFVRCIERLAGDELLRRRMSHNARRLAESEFDRARVVQPLLAFLHQV